MRDMKAFASLTSGLLARKGAARPAMRPQGYAEPGGPARVTDDLGWNDMGDDRAPPPRRHPGVRLPASLSGSVPAVAAVPAIPEVVRQQSEIAREFAVDPTPAVEPKAEPVAVAAPARASDPSPTATHDPAPPSAAAPAVRAEGRRAAFTLRLDPARHLRLRLACAVEHRSAQQIVTAALDALLAERPDLDRMAVAIAAGADKGDPQ